MDYEKEYKSLVAKVKKAHLFAQTDSTKKVLEDILPQLCESEDERNIDTIFNCLYQCCDTGFISGTQRDNALAWLEKQKECFLVPKSHIDPIGEPGVDGMEILEKQKEPHYTKRNALFDKCVENCDPDVMKEVSDKVDDMLGKEQKPAEWKDYKDKVNIPYCSSKPEWSEEDEDKLEQCIRIVRGWEGDYDIVRSPYSNFLKSLRPSWKPSEEQMEALERASTNKYLSAKQFDILVSLYEQLKKL